MNNKFFIFILVLSLLAILGGGAYWFFILKEPSTETITETPADLFPFDNETGEQNNPGNNSGTGGLNPIRNTPQPVLRQITPEPVAGATAFAEASSTVIRYNERRLGDIFQTTTNDSTLTRLDREVSEGIYDSYWVENGTAVVFRYVDQNTERIRSIYGKLILETPEIVEDDVPLELPSWSFTAKPLVTEIRELAVSPSSEQMFTITPTAGGVDGIVMNPDGSSQTKIFDSPFSEWTASWPSEDTILIANKPQNTMDGYAYTLDTDTARLTRVLGPLPGLTVLMSPDEEVILYSVTNSTRISTYLYDVRSGATRAVPLAVLPEKCVWKGDSTVVYCGANTSMPVNSYPDAWYKGLMSFNDSLWSIDRESLTREELVNPFDFARVEIDVIRPFLSENENYLYFINKKDSSLWSLQLAEEERVIVEDRESTE
ncbi:MAG: hypothetical protein WDZ88_01835 [Candidatus Paceibacterota bacterium]